MSKLLFQIITVILLLQVGETEMFCGRKLEVASVLLTRASFLCIRAPFSFSLAASGVPSQDLCVVGWQGMRDRLQNWPASILYSSACGLSTGDQKPCGRSLRLLGEFIAVV